MAFHHVAIAVRDAEASHHFYTEVMGFTLERTEVVPYLGSGWARHLFYDTGDGTMLALWDLHPGNGPITRTAISTDLGLPKFVNHIAFGAADPDELDALRERVLAHGHDVVRVDHGWCTSIYINDPNGIMVEFCCTTKAVTEADRREAAELLAAAAPTVAPAGDDFEVFEADRLPVRS